MRRRLAYSTFLLIACVAIVAGLLRGEAEEDPSSAAVNALILRLGDAEFSERELAAKELAALGDVALPALRIRATDRRDSEIRWRAQQLVRVIGLQSRTSKTTGMNFVLLEAGEFVMGSPATETGRRSDEQAHRVTITRPFWLGVYEVTQAEYFRVMDRRPSWFAPGGGGKDRIAAEDTSRFPVENVSWFDAAEFCNRMSKSDGYPPYYTITDPRVTNDSIASATVAVAVAGGNGYRLPTEAEWEYACRAGSAGSFHFGEQNTGREANLRPIAVAGGYGAVPKWPDLARTTSVGGFPANVWGLHDMHGNAYEWCWDWYDEEYFGKSPRENPTGPETGRHRLARGGSWLVHEASCRSAARAWKTPDERKPYLGFRVARSP